MSHEVRVPSTVFVEPEKFSFFIRELLLLQVLGFSIPYHQIENFSPLLDKKGKRFSRYSLPSPAPASLLSEYGELALRLSLLIQKSFEIPTLMLYDAFLKQTRNAIRFFSLHQAQPLTFAQAQAEFSAKADHFDVRIFSEFSTLWEEYLAAETYQQQIEFFPLLQQFLQKKLFHRYLEYQKIKPTPAKDATLYLLFSYVLQILFPFVPQFVEEIRGYT
jgi:valyl-tRNA synthetase